MLPAIFGDNLFDEWMRFPSFRGFDGLDRKLFGKDAVQVMRTDVREHDDRYELAIDLPGFTKEELELSLEDGYLTVKAAKKAENEEKAESGKLIRQERYTGSVQRSFLVGDAISEEEIKAKFENGVLHLEFPRRTEKKLPERKTIMIEG